MTQPELHFGASMPFGSEDTVYQAKWMEKLGYEYFAVGEHFVRGSPPRASDAALPVLGVAAGATERIRLLSAALLAPFYHPTVLAKLTTSLDIASAGRLTLGVGIGGEFPMEFKATGLNVRQRGHRTNECLEVLRKLWTTNNVTYEGNHFQLDNVTINPMPSQLPHPPIWVAGRRDAAMLRAARYGDGWLPYFYSPKRYLNSVEKITSFANESGRELDERFQWAYFPYIAIYPTVDEAAKVASETLGEQYLYKGDFLNVVRRYCILGPVEQCINRLHKYVDSGARHIIFSLCCHFRDRSRHMETIIKEIVPELRSRVNST